jgi:ankyrin repeat protein
MPSAPQSDTVDAPATFARALRDGNAEDARNLLLRFAELRRAINEPHPGGDFGARPIHTAVRAKNRELIDVLISAGADINARSDWWAGSFGVLDTCAPDFAPFLIERGANVDAHAASRLGMLDTLRDLLDSDPNVVSLRGGDGQTPLHVASNVDIATLLLSKGAELDALDVDHESTPAQYAIGERPDVARFLVSRGAHADILLATALGDLDRVRRILDANPASIRASVDSTSFPMKNSRAGGSIYIWTLGGNKTALQIGAERGHEDILALLLSRAPDEVKLAHACETGDDVTIAALLATNPDLPTTLSSSEAGRLIAAAEGGKADVVERMLRAGWRADMRDDRNVTALHWAAWQGNAAMVSALIAAGAPIDARESTFDGDPLGWAMHGSLNCARRDLGDYKTVVKELVKAGAKLPPGDYEASAEVRAALAAAIVR